MLGDDGQRYQETQHHESFPNKVSDKMSRDHKQENGMESAFANKQLESPSSEEEPPAANISQNPKYQLFLASDIVGKVSRNETNENGPRSSQWESSNSRFGSNNHRGSLESLASRDWDTMSDRVGGFDSPPRVFNSPYAAHSIDHVYRNAEYKDMMSPAPSDLSVFSYNSRSVSPVPSPTVSASRGRFPAYDTLTRRREPSTSPYLLKTTAPYKRDYIEELTKQLDEIQKRNQFLEAESIEMDKERNQIRFEMRGLLVHNEDLFRTNTQLQVEMKRMRENMAEMEMEISALNERLRQQERELKEAREAMVEANTQEFAFGFLQQALKNKIEDAEEALEKQTKHSQTLSEKLWHMEREVEELRVDKEMRDKKNSELSNTVLRLEAELGDALKAASQSAIELSLQQKLKNEAQLQVEELEESLLENTQELDKAQQIVRRLQGEIAEKLTDKEKSLEEEIQLRERIQLQCKQAERTVEDLQMELEAMAQSKEEVVKQLKQTQEKVIDLESDLEELLDNEQRSTSKYKRASEQAEQFQMKLIQEKDLNDQLEYEKAILEREIKDLHKEIQELQNTRVQDDIIIKFESKIKDLENSLRTEERNKGMLTNNIGKLERKVSELMEQTEEERKLAMEQKDLMAQRIRSLKRQLNDSEEEAGRKEAQHRHTQRELTEEREATARLQKQLLEQNLQMKWKDSLVMRQTLENRRIDLDKDDEHGIDSTTSKD
ncbi:uncharacterized protein [Paramormyrops kingsleyae]|uniref:uncharacterized protein n=1 Tax=Paramormyrops kingsleyae TaxID=1676925 RepID=UPI000CD5F391|nr:cingulin-like protein 1 [Paramormyrops kingsleyae]XP_023667467.1 cingulin-like protein 1 [Paramormyrops kingsleyae]